jgi:Ornithine cyclodeaminase/mu-crystallin family
MGSKESPNGHGFFVFFDTSSRTCHPATHALVRGTRQEQVMEIRCTICSRHVASGTMGRCSRCGGMLQPFYPHDSVRKLQLISLAPGIDRYRSFLPLTGPIPCLGEGNTPLIPSRRIGPFLGLKVVSVFPGNHGTPYDSHMGPVMIFETQHGQPLAIMDATEITAIRTAAVSGVATRLLAREDAGDLAILRTGTQAKSHLEAMLLCRKIRRFRVWSRNQQNAVGFGGRESQHHEIKVEPVATVKSAVEGAIEDIASAAHIYRRALGKGVGMLVELGGRREA